METFTAVSSIGLRPSVAVRPSGYAASSRNRTRLSIWIGPGRSCERNAENVLLSGVDVAGHIACLCSDAGRLFVGGAPHSRHPAFGPQAQDNEERTHRRAKPIRRRPFRLRVMSRLSRPPNFCPPYPHQRTKAELISWSLAADPCDGASRPSGDLVRGLLSIKRLRTLRMRPHGLERDQQRALRRRSPV